MRGEWGRYVFEDMEESTKAKADAFREELEPVHWQELEVLKKQKLEIQYQPQTPSVKAI